MKNNLHFSIPLVVTCFLSLGASLSFAFQGSDVEVVSNPNKPVLQVGKRKRIAFKEELTIGTSEGDENYMFGEQVSVIADDEGCLYVLDWDRKRIQKIDPEGKYLLTLGRRGQGPGEFGNLWNPNFDIEGNIYVTDIVNKRITFFTQDGVYIKDIKTPVDVRGVTMLPDGHYLTSRREVVEEKGVSIYTTIFGVYDLKFDLTAEIHRETRETRQRGDRSRAEFIAEIESRGAFKPNFISCVTKNGFFYAGYPSDYEIRLFDQKGVPIKIIRREYDPVKISQKHKEDFFNQNVIDLLRVSGRTSEVHLKDEVRKFMKYPKYLPAYQWFTLMNNGWLFVIVDAIENEEAIIDLFDNDGLYIGQFSTKIPLDSLYFKNGKAYTVATLDGYKYVKRYSYMIEEYR